MKTKDNLNQAFSGESMAAQKYQAFAVQADKEGLENVARLFRATAYAETIHAQNHLRAAHGVGTTAENLTEAIKGETYEFEQMYPPMIADAVKEGSKQAEISMNWALQVEKGHEALYRQALQTMGGGCAVDYYVCSVCGYTHAVGDGMPDKCPVCGAPAKAFRKID